jgi:hypothetical protein
VRSLALIRAMGVLQTHTTFGFFVMTVTSALPGAPFFGSGGPPSVLLLGGHREPCKIGTEKFD